QQADRAGIKPLDEQSLEVCFLSPRKPATPGQIAAFYTRSGLLLGGGIIA
ncbi:MAG: tRNA 2-thiouridine(34) synthase MnmA, partial [Desulfohalobiaceae bacterium]|nr:tRNA 2-thiouridine(34) synthase MnmA [Desulfohalobiaceae bacterium]